MIPHAIRVASFSAAFALANASFAMGQEAAPAAEAPRCGGLLCDLGIIGGPSSATSLPCNDFLCRAFGGDRRVAAAPPPEPVPVVSSAPAKPERKVRKKRMAKSRPVTDARGMTGSEPK